MRQMMKVILMEIPLSTAVSVGSLWDCYEMSYTFTVSERFFCVQPLCGMYENIMNCV